MPGVGVVVADTLDFWAEELLALRGGDGADLVITDAELGRIVQNEEDMERGC